MSESNGHADNGDCLSIELKDVGYFHLTIDGVKLRLDLCRFNNRIYDLDQKRQAENISTNEYHDEIREYLKELGFPECSDLLIVDLVEAITKAMIGLKKKESDDSKPDSLVSTGLTASA